MRLKAATPVCDRCGGPGPVRPYRAPTGRRYPSYRCRKCYLLSLVHRLRNSVSLYSVEEARDASGRHGRTNYIRKQLRRKMDSVLFALDVRRKRQRRRQAAIAPKEWAALKKRYDNRCVCCGRREPEIRLTQDHIVAVTQGGSGQIDNVQPLCSKCNSKKGSSNTDYRTSFQLRWSKARAPRSK